MHVTYNGVEVLTFTDYLDLETGRTLHAEPGGTYDIAPASGRVVPEVPEPWFTLTGPPPPPGDGEPGGETVMATAALEGEAALGDGESAEPASDENPDGQEPSAF